MSVATVKTALASMLAGVTGLSAAQVFVNAPYEIGDLPALVILTGANTITPSGATQAIDSREYRLRLYVAQIGQGTDGELEAKVNAWFPTIRDYLLARPRLSSTTGVQMLTYNGDSGPMVASYASQDYLSIEYRVTVSEFVVFTYAANN